jgi:hypothetical protein
MLLAKLEFSPFQAFLFLKCYTNARFWGMVTDSLPPQESAALAEDLGIEFDTAEHKNLDQATASKAKPCTKNGR